MQRGEPVIIDVGQGMTTEHFNAKEFLVRDIKNINHFFRSYDVKIVENEVLLKQIMGVKK
jgi:RIO kinase 1